MTLRMTGMVFVFVAQVATLAAQSPQKPTSQMPDLGRPTRPDDPLPTLDFDRYFTGRWTFEWDIPESPFGPAGAVTGIEVYARGRGEGSFVSDYEGESPAGRFKGHAVIRYNREAKSIDREETDSRGFSIKYTGKVGGDLGGAFTIYEESEPFTYKGQQLRLKLTKTMASPLFFRVRALISVDGGPFMNLGNPWWKKEVPKNE